MKVEYKQMYEFHWAHGLLVNSELVAEMSNLYSRHYGIWGPTGRKPGEQIKLSSAQITNWLTEDSLVVWATAFGSMVGYAIAIDTQLSGHGKVAWITQLVVHKDHRQVDVGKTLLFTIWGFSDYFAWGLLSANPYAIRALEKATRRRCQPEFIATHASALLALGAEQVHYLADSREFLIDENKSRVDTAFDIDHSELPAMLLKATDDTKPWVMGDLPEGWEWLAFTFHNQPQISLAEKELEEMLLASDKITKQAYSRMRHQWQLHPWAQYASEEVEFMLRYSGIPDGASVIDFGCGNGRHSFEFAKYGFQVTAVDYVQESVGTARELSQQESLPNIRFHYGDCRTTEIGGQFDLGICLYDVIGSQTDGNSNAEILENLVKHTKDGGYIFLSVMNMELTERLAKNRFSISANPDKLLSLPPSDIMEKSGNVFNPDFYLIDNDKNVVYRKEQFHKGEELFGELLVRDRRYAQEEIVRMCTAVGLDVVWSRFVRAGHWDEPLDRESDKAKEILVMCRKTYQEALQQRLFY
ncbi:MAG TPA: class I SAM-dependent methyltransferase [Acidobacteriaceae bacterium]|nr:class I SAM-dependent methyltransferase [Acidobacteriaceae bacterium]